MCVTISMSKNLVLLLAFSQGQSAYLNVFSYINSEFKYTQKILFYGTKISPIIKKLLRKIIPERWRLDMSHVTSRAERDGVTNLPKI